jgi:hypothetical protein
MGIKPLDVHHGLVSNKEARSFLKDVVTDAVDMTADIARDMHGPDLAMKLIRWRLKEEIS